MSSDLSGRTVIVTGGSRGLGAALVDGFLNDGDNVATCSRSHTAAIAYWEADPSARDRFSYAALDMQDREAIAKFVRDVIDRFGRIDVLVNNAGIAHDGVLGLMSDQQVDSIIDLNLKGTIHMTKSVARHMLTTGSGRIINISSIVGLAGYRGLAVYSATKAALDGFTRALSRELAPRSITVNSVAPGYLNTEMSHGLSEGQLDQIVRRTPVGRLGDATDVFGAVRYLASADASFVTGHVLVVDGGLTA